MKKKITYEGLLDIPQETAGEFEVRHIIEPAGALLQTASYRTMLYGQHDGGTVSYDHPTRWHELLEGGGRWTSDLPIEQWQQRAAVKGFRGKVLVGGLGLGVVARILAEQKNVTRIDVIEKSAEVVKLVGPYILDPRIHIHVADLFDFLRHADRQWHYAFFDIWAQDNEYTFYETVLPLKELAGPFVRYPVRNWNEDIMRGQVRQSLMSPLHMAMAGISRISLDALAEDTDDQWHARLVPFYRALRDAKVDLHDPLTMQKVDVSAWRWATRYDGTEEFGVQWEERFADHWNFVGIFVEQSNWLNEEKNSDTRASI